jgi:hypothetical protein
MRVIERKMVEAVRSRKNMRGKNTEVMHGENTTTVFLHKHPIAVFIWSDNTVAVSNCGWQTVTTKSRLNALLRVFTNNGIHQHRYVWYMDDKQEFRNGTRVPLVNA